MQFSGCWNALNGTVRMVVIAMASIVVAPALIWYSRKFRRMLNAPLARESLKDRARSSESNCRDIGRSRHAELRDEFSAGLDTQDAGIVPLARESLKGRARSPEGDCRDAGRSRHAELRDKNKQDARIIVVGVSHLEKLALSRSRVFLAQ